MPKERDDGDRGKDGDLDQNRGRDRNEEGHRDRDLPKTLVYSFTGAENVCAGASSCDYRNVKSITWNGDSVSVALMKPNPLQNPTQVDLSIPIAKFAPIEKANPEKPH